MHRIQIMPWMETDAVSSGPHLSYINYPETIVNSGFQNVGMDVFYVIETFMLELVLVWKWNPA
jgi:hypothetical protein